MVGALSPIEDIIEDARNGRMFVLVDAEDRENEGDLVIPAQFATPDQVNFMAKHGRGLICLALTQDRADQLALRPMASENRTPLRTAFMVSIEARDGITTGISAHDRARTIAVAIDPSKGPDDIISPGHVFPLTARNGGVLARAGHTEAAVDIAQLAGLAPAGVICEIMNDDGTMARLPDLIAVAQRYGLKVGAIADLIAYRRRHERLVERRLETEFDSRWGAGFRLFVFVNVLDGAEHVALMKGRPRADEPSLVRMHKVDFAADVLGEASARGRLVGEAVEAVAAAEHGVVVFIRETHRSAITERFGATVGAGGDDRETRALREYGVGAQILRDLGVRDMILLTNTPMRVPGLEGYGLKIVGARSFGAAAQADACDAGASEAGAAGSSTTGRDDG